MRGFAVWMLPVILFLSAAAFGTAQEATPAGSESSKGCSWLTGWLPFGKKADNSKQAPKESAAVPEQAGHGAGEGPTTVTDAASTSRAREYEVLQRRIHVCDQLLLIGDQVHDEELMRKAEQLHDRAWAVYVERTAQLNPRKTGGFESDEQTLSKHLGSFSMNEQAPPPPDLTLGALENSSRTAARRE